MLRASFQLRGGGKQMRFLVIAEPNGNAVPPESIPSLLEAEQSWRDRYADRIDDYHWYATGGGGAIVDVDDAETLCQAIVEHPFNPYTKTEVRPLVDAGVAARGLEASLAAANAAS
jgi:hypothetical protein